LSKNVTADGNPCPWNAACSANRLGCGVDSRHYSEALGYEYEERTSADEIFAAAAGIAASFTSLSVGLERSTAIHVGRLQDLGASSR
jgi:hypothetical protein